MAVDGVFDGVLDSILNDRLDNGHLDGVQHNNSDFRWWQRFAASFPAVHALSKLKSWVVTSSLVFLKKWLALQKGIAAVISQTLQAGWHKKIAFLTYI